MINFIDEIKNLKLLPALLFSFQQNLEKSFGRDSTEKEEPFYKKNFRVQLHCII